MSLILTSCTLNYDKSGHIYQPPLSRPFNVSDAASNLEIIFEIKKKGNHVFGIEYQCGDDENKCREVRKLIYEFHHDKHRSVKMPIDLEIIKISESKKETIIFKKIVDPDQTNVGYHYSKDLASLILEKGLYKVTVKTTKAVPEMKSIKTEFFIGGESGWNFITKFFGWLFSPWL